MKNQRGDTLIEVLLATVIIASVLAAAYTLTNRASRGNQAAIERSTVANLMREQIELVRAIRISGHQTGSWDKIIDDHTQTAVPNYDVWDVPTDTSKSFFINPYTNPSDPTVVDLLTSAIVKAYPGPSGCSDDLYPDDRYCVWIEVHEEDSANDFVDIHVRAYWLGIGDIGPQRESLILRLQK